MNFCCTCSQNISSKIQILFNKSNLIIIRLFFFTGLLISLSSCALNGRISKIIQYPSTGFLSGKPTNLSCQKAAESRYGSGSGSSSDPFIICDRDQMNTLAATPSDWGYSFKLGNDINLEGYKGIGIYDENMDSSTWVPFTGTFDGDNYYLIGIDVDTRGTLKCGGVFNWADRADFKNITIRSGHVKGYCTGLLFGTGYDINLENIDVEGSVTGWETYSGLVGSYLWNANRSTSLTNIRATGNIESDSRVGGVIGKIYSSSSVTMTATNISSNVNLSFKGTFYVGGVIGSIQLGDSSVATFTNISSSGTMNNQNATVASQRIGGLFGEFRTTGANSRLTMTQSTSNMSLNLNSVTLVGGIIGLMMNGSSNATNGVLVTKTNFKGSLSVTGSTLQYIGGLVGGFEGANTSTGPTSIEDSYVSGSVSVSGTPVDSVGLFVGGYSSWSGAQVVTVKRSYARGSLTSSAGTNIGAFLGKKNSARIVSTQNYFDSASSSYQGVGDDAAETQVSGLATGAMTSQSSFTGFDFTNVWKMPASSTPALIWEP